MRRILILVALAGLPLFGFGIATPASAHMEFTGYIYDSDYDQMDPIGMIFAGNASSSAVNSHFQHHLGWYQTDGTTMRFNDHWYWDNQDGQRATESSTSGFPRYHFRWDEGRDYGGYYGTYSIGTAHRDRLAWDFNCQFGPFGHRSSEFNNTRDTITAYMGNGHTIEWSTFWQGNTAPVTNCDGYQESGDGWLNVIWL